MHHKHHTVQPVSNNSHLPFTGANLAYPATAGFALVVAGFIAVLWSRRGRVQ